MKSVYRIPRPFTISFSGGRTSAYMLYEILNAYDGKLPRDGYVLFANTGKERDETLEFVQAVSEAWSVPVTWLEYCERDGQKDFRIVDFKSAHRSARANSPFEILLRSMSTLPNPVSRNCTAELKIRTMRRYQHAVLGWDDDFYRHCGIGIRADERHRELQISADCPQYIKPLFPMIRRAVSEKDVMKFWSKQTFDLKLKQSEGNCDLCFLKSRPKLLNLIRSRPESVDWWIEMEQMKQVGSGSRFRDDRSYSGIRTEALNQSQLFETDTDESDTPCGCGAGVGDWSDVGELN